MKIRIVEFGWENYNGYLGPVEFVEGVSVDDVPTLEIDRIGASIKVEKLRGEGDLEGVQIGVQVRLIDDVCKTEDTTPLYIQTEEEKEAENKRAEDAALNEKANREPSVFYSSSELSKIFDEDGIKGLRLIADQIGAKGRSGSEIISDILVKQAEIKDAVAKKRKIDESPKEVTNEDSAFVETKVEDTENKE